MAGMSYRRLCLEHRPCCCRNIEQLRRSQVVRTTVDMCDVLLAKPQSMPVWCSYIIQRTGNLSCVDRLSWTTTTYESFRRQFGVDRSSPVFMWSIADWPAVEIR